MVSLGTALEMRSLNNSVGATVKRCGSAFSIWKLRSGIRFLAHHRGPFFQSLEEASNLLPDFGSAGQPAPVSTNQAHQFVTLVDVKQIILRSSKSADMSNPVHEQSFNISFHFLQHRISILNVRPSLERQQRLGRPSRTWIQSDDPFIWCTTEEKSHADGNHQAVPLGLGETKICQRKNPSGNALVLRPHPAK